MLIQVIYNDYTNPPFTPTNLGIYPCPFSAFYPFSHFLLLFFCLIFRYSEVFYFAGYGGSAEQIGEPHHGHIVRAYGQGS